MIETPFKLTKEETIASAAATLLLFSLERSGTQQRNLSDVCENPQYGFTASASWQPLGPRFVRITDIKAGTIEWAQVPYCQCENLASYSLTQGDILVARSGSVGKSFLVEDVPEPAVFASYMIRLRARSGELPDYIYWCLQSQQFWQQVMEERRGSAMKNINGQMLSALHFPWPNAPIQEAIVAFLDSFRRRLRGEKRDLPTLPPPLDEQYRIISHIEELAAKIEEARGLRQEAVAEGKAFAHSAAAKVFADNKHADLRTVEESCEVRGGIQKSSARTPGANPRRYITVAHVQRNWIDTTDPRYFEVSKDELERWRLLPGDVLVIEGNGSADQIGRAAVFQGEITDCVHQNHVIRVRPEQGHLLSEYLNAYLNSPVGRDQMLERSRTTSGLYNLSVGRIKSIVLPVPPLPEQRRIVAYMDNLQAKVDSLKKLQEKTAEGLDALMPSILSKAFSGEL